MPADVKSAVWELEASVSRISPTVDLRGPQIQGPPGKRFIYLTWGVVDSVGVFTMFRRAKLWLTAVPVETFEAACRSGLLIGRLGLSDDDGWPLCASVRPPRIEWSQELGDARQPAFRVTPFAYGRAGAK